MSKSKKDENELPHTRTFKFWVSFQRIAGILALIGVVVTVLTLWFQIRTKVLGGEIQVLLADKLTPFIDVPGLESKFEYQGDSVQELWKLRLRLVNDGDLTIIGRDSRKNILGEGIILGFPVNSKVLVIVEEKKDSSFPHTLTYLKITDSNGIPRENENVLQLKFDQWRPEEAVVYSLYISSDVNEQGPPLPHVDERCIIDGRLAVKDLHIATGLQPKPIIERLPKPMAVTGKILGVILACLLIVGATIFFINGVYERIRIWLWKRKHFAKYVSFIESAIDFNKHYFSKEHYLKEPWSLDADQWKDFSGPKCPVSYPDFDNIWQLILAGVIVLLIVLASLSLIASAIVQ